MDCEIKDTISFTLVLPKKKYFGINLNIDKIYMRKKYKTLIEELNKWRDISCSWIERLNIIKMSILPNLNLQMKSNPNKNSSKLIHGFFKNSF